MRPNRATLLVLAALAAVGAVLAVGLTQQENGPPATAPAGRDDFVAFDAPRTAGRTLAGDAFDLTELRGTPVVVNFWATWCEGCKAEAPELAALQRRLGGRARLVGVDVDDRAGPARAFAARAGWTYPHLVATADLAFDYGVVGFPSTVLVDADGRVVDKITGATTAAAIERRLARLNPSS